MIGISVRAEEPDRTETILETIHYRRSPELPGVELRSVSNHTRCFDFYSTGFEFLVPSTWRGEVWHRRRRHIVEPGWLLSAHPGDVFVSERVLEGGCWTSLTIDADLFRSLVCQGATEDHAPVRLRPLVRMSKRLATDLLGLIDALQTGARPCAARARLKTFLVGVSREVVDQDALTYARSTGRDLHSRAAERFACFRRETPGRVPLADLTNETGLSRFQALRAFKRQFGLAPCKYQLRVRLGLAQKALREGGGVADVAAALGFVDQSHLTRHFRRFVGVTPAAYARGDSRISVD